MDLNERTIGNHQFLSDILLTKDDIDKCIGSISKLSQSLSEPIIITGSLAILYHLLKSGKPTKKRQLNDIDTVYLTDFSQIGHSLGRNFLINHFHPLREKGKVLLQLVDEEYRTRIEVFTPQSDTLAQRLTNLKIGELTWRVVSAEDLLAKLLSIIYSILEDQSVDPKYAESFNLLAEIANQNVVQKVWQDYRKEGQFINFDEAAQSVKVKIAANPDLLQPTEYCQDINIQCLWCRESEVFPIASRSQIHEILAYV
ncbi:MAG TPA: hypothetical protein PKY82_02680 [Pyrinomonadaceae bacterium]|nr:hypothetical protein [Pyrinomonadaceae bacterium]